MGRWLRGDLGSDGGGGMVRSGFEGLMVSNGVGH
jgi:hypothetical protein